MIKYIVVQAGGKGTRMEYLTANKPKCLVPVNNLPMLFHLFQKYSDRKFIVIGDYKCDILREYLKAFADVEYLLVEAPKNEGTCAGIRQAISYIPEHSSFMLIWSDLILPESFVLPETSGNYVGLSGDFQCRWKYENGAFEEMMSVERGVAGLFLFQDKSVLQSVPEKGEFVRWLKGQKIHWRELMLRHTKEYGLVSDYEKLEQKKCRPFNRMTVEGNRIIKEGINEQGKKLAVREKLWYRHVADLGYKQIPSIYSYEPFIMEKINGKNIYEYAELPLIQKRRIVEKVVKNLQYLHSLESCQTDYFSIKETYLDKTFKRLSKIRNLLPFADQKTIRVNGRDCPNIYFYQKELEKICDRYKCAKFCLIHGDCTFSNMLLRDDQDPILIDPRGYFGNTELYGDPAYDWAKLYYSIVGNYDRFNLKKFRLRILKKEILLEIESNGFEQTETTFFTLLQKEISKENVKLLHALIWLSLTTYAWENYDSICGAFYNGLYYLAEVLTI